MQLLIVLFILTLIHRAVSVIGGDVVAKNQYPFIVNLVIQKTIRGDSFVFHCAGTILSGDVIITAAHCLFTGDPDSPVMPKDIKVYYGNTNAITNDTITVSSLTINKNYDDGKKENDIAIIRLESMLPLGYPNVNRIPITTKIITPGTVLTVAGWGETKPDDESSLSPVLLSTDYITPSNPLIVCGRNETVGSNNDILCDEKCFGADSSYQGVAGQFVCAQPKSSGFCLGDDGGPLILKENNGYMLIGIISSAQTSPPEPVYTCGSSNSYGFFTNPYYFQNFVSEFSGLSLQELLSPAGTNS